MSKEIAYKKRIVCYLDILGFKDMVSKEEELSRLVETIQNVNTAADLEKYDKFLEIEKLQVSDGILFWAPMTDFIEAIVFIYKIGITVAQLASQQVVLRGAVSFGKHYSNDGILISPAFIQAFEHEQKVANVPRVILTTGLLKHLKSLAIESDDNLKNEYILGKLLRKDRDGFRYIDYLSISDISFNSPDKGMENSDAPNEKHELIFKLHKLLIHTGLKNKSASIKSKYIWLGHYHNDFINHGTNWPNKKDFLIEDSLLDQI